MIDYRSSVSCTYGFDYARFVGLFVVEGISVTEDPFSDFQVFAEESFVGVLDRDRCTVLYGIRAEFESFHCTEWDGSGFRCCTME